MIALLCFFLTLFASPFKSKSRLEAENAALRHQVIVLERRVSGRVQFTNGDRLFLVISLVSILRNVVANYPFERPHRFPGIQPSSGQTADGRVAMSALYGNRMRRKADHSSTAFARTNGRRVKGDVQRVRDGSPGMARGRRKQ